MLINNIYIISWFGKDPALREKRQQKHKIQLEWCWAHNLHPVVFAQEYADEDFVDNVTYIKNTGPLLMPGPARNQLLKHFYESTNDFGVFADNDGVLYESVQHGDSAQYVEIMRKLPIDDYAAVDLIDPVNPARIPFSDEITTDIYKTHLVYYRTNKVKGTLFFIKNLKKHKNTELYFDEQLFNDNGKMLPGEDTEFAIAASMQGFGCYYTYNAIVKELAPKDSTWTSTNEHKNIVPIYHSINKKYQVELFVIPRDVVKTFSYIGYYKSSAGKYVFQLTTNKAVAWKQHTLTKENYSDIKFYEIPLLTVADAIQYALTNINDTTLHNIIADDKKKNKTHANLGKNKVRFNWTVVPITIPTLPKKIQIFKTPEGYINI